MIKREKKERVRVGWVGLGRRGYGMFKEHLSKMCDVDIVWLCDLDIAKLERAEAHLESVGKPVPKSTRDYRDIIAAGDVDAVIIMTGWGGRVELAVEFMKAGIYTAIEVGCAHDLEQCYKLVETYEIYETPVMMLENCCYGRRELMALNMVRQGLFGEVVHAEGSYTHYLSKAELFQVNSSNKEDVDHYRQYEYAYRNCDNYPTHAFGPISKILRINRGNRLMTLSSFASKAAGINEYRREKLSEDHPLKNVDLKQGDIITTVITCAGGETVRLTLDTTLPIPHYSRSFSIRGTKGCCIEEGNSATFYLEGMEEGVAMNEGEFFEKYDHPLQRENQAAGVKSGHADGIDWLVLRAFVEAVKAGTDTPIDAYDTASWLAIGPLSAQSIATGGMPQAFPDFTSGRWFRREDAVMSKYCLDEIVVDETIKISPEK